MSIKVKAIRYNLSSEDVGDFWIEEDDRSGKIHLFLVPQDPDNLDKLRDIFLEGTESKIKTKKVDLPEEEDSDSDSESDSDSDSDDE